jgi:hypothetical protein
VPADGVGEGDGLGDGEGAGAGVPGLFERDGTPAVDTGDGDVGSTEPQLIVESATASEAMRMGVRICRPGYARRAPEHVGRKLQTGAPQ